MDALKRILKSFGLFFASVLLVLAGALILTPIIGIVSKGSEFVFETASEYGSRFLSQGQVDNAHGKQRDDLYFEELSQQINMKLPMAANAKSTLVTTNYTNGAFYYIYKFADAEFEANAANKFVKSMKPKMQNAYCTSAESLPFRQNDVGHTAIFYDKNAVQIASISISPSDCISK